MTILISDIAPDGHECLLINTHDAGVHRKFENTEEQFLMDISNNYRIIHMNIDAMKDS